MLVVQKYLREGNPLVSLAGEPYNLIIKEEGDLVLLKYNQLTSDFNEPIVKECRGIILYKKTWDVVCWPFSKFFNLGEPYADCLDESRIYVYQKIDGSLAKVWYFEGIWRLSSNGLIDASEASLGEGINMTSLFQKALREYGLDWESFTSTLDKEYTYMYELATPDNKVVVPYEDYNLFYLGQRHNKTGQEVYMPDDRISNVKVYTFQTIDDVINSANELPDSEEGYVVRDQYWHRVKIKNPTYFMLHKLANNGKPDIVQYVLENNADELLSYFPEYRKDVNKVQENFVKLEKRAFYYADRFKRYYELTRAEFAQAVFHGGVPVYFQSYIFKTYENHNLTWADYTINWTIYDWKRILERAEGDLL